MERLTTHEIKEYILANYFDGDENVNACIDGDEEIIVMANIVKSLEKLAEYEDMEEKGDLIKVKHGEWKDELENFDTYGCSVCNKHYGNTYNYCPNCGAKMDLEEEE